MGGRRHRGTGVRRAARAAVTSGSSVLVVGGGVIGCSIARELAGRGVDAVVLERAEPGAEASSAAAGLIAPQAEGLPPGPLFDLAIASRALYPRLSEELAGETGADVGWRRKGILRCRLDGGEGISRYAWQREAGLTVEEAGVDRIREITAGLAGSEAREGLFFPEDGIVDPRRLTRALAESARRRGVRFVTAAARRFLADGGLCRGVETDGGDFEADVVVDAAGAWASIDPEVAPVAVEPVRGQIVDLRPEGPMLPSVLESEDVYLVPRDDGSLLVGSTEERVGFLKEVTAGAVVALVVAACRLAPSLSRARLAGAWAGLRPGSADGLPILGPANIPGLYFATGHFRNGILLAPITARLVADALTGVPAPMLEPFSPGRPGLNPAVSRRPSVVFG
ncbi:MAG: glycine oxidase ThiO [Acidobacteriota bacterium]